MTDQQESEIPEAFVCPITNELMVDPVMSKFGHSYERHAIVEWLAAHSNTCPLTRQKMRLSDLITNQSLRVAIRQWQIDHEEDITVIATDVEKPIIGYFDLPDLDDTERTESSDSDAGEDLSDPLRHWIETHRQRNAAAPPPDPRPRRSRHRSRAPRTRPAAQRSVAQAFLDSHRRRILSYLRPEHN